MSNQPESMHDIIERVGKLIGQEKPSADIVAVEAELLSPDAPDFVQAETFLENSGFFTPSSKRIKKIQIKRKKVKEIERPDGSKQTLTITISANAQFGLPITIDLDYYRAFLKHLDEIFDDNNRLPRMPVTVPTKKLIRYAGRKVSKQELTEVRNWIKRMTLTGLSGAVYRAKSKDFDTEFVGTVFSQAVLRGERNRHGQVAETHQVWLSPWFVSNYFYHHTRPIDHAFYKRLRKPIAKSLYTLLGNGWYASSGNPYAKNYKALCEEFLLTERKYLAEVRRQLDPAHKELQREKFLDRWEYHQSTKTNDIIITYYAGQKFFQDRYEQGVKQEIAVNGQQSLNLNKGNLTEEQTARTESLLADIIDVCGDRENIAAYKKILKSYPHGLIRASLSETKLAAAKQRITKSRGAYFTDTLKRLNEARKNRE